MEEDSTALEETIRSSRLSGLHDADDDPAEPSAAMVHLANGTMEHTDRISETPDTTKRVMFGDASNIGQCNMSILVPLSFLSTDRQMFKYFGKNYMYCTVTPISDWGIPSSNGIPYRLANFFFLLFLLPVNMAFSEAKYNEGNPVLDLVF